MLKGDTYSNRSPCPYRLVLRVFECAPGIPHDTVDRECRQAHGRHGLENRALCHDSPVVFDRGDQPWRDLHWPAGLDAFGAGCVLGDFLDGVEDTASGRWDFGCGGFAILGLDVVFGVEYLLVAAVGFVAFVRDVADQVGPGYAVRSFHQIWMGDWSERLSYVRCICNVALRA
jgi:hypothetical protein